MKIPRHFKMAVIYQLLIAGWKFDIKNLYMSYVYNCYFVLVRALYILFLISASILIGIQMADRNWALVMANLTVLLSFIPTEAKIHLCRSAPIQGLLRSVEKVEDSIFEGDDEPVKKIYIQHATRSNRSYMVHMTLCCIVSALYIIFPSMPVDLVDKGRPQKYTPLNCYVWFDTYEYVNIVRVFQYQALSTFSITYSSSDCIFFGMLCYIAGQLKILQYHFENSHEYALEIHRRDGVPLEEAQKQFIKTCITTYKDIIRCTKILNTTLGTLMFVNFFQTSVKLAFLLVYFIQLPVRFCILGMCVFLYLTFETLGVYFYYWNANEVLYQSSEGLARAIWKAKWYEFSDSVKKALVLTLARTQIPCKMQIGPFYDMDLDAAIKILKGCYGYVCLILNRQNN